MSDTTKHAGKLKEFPATAICGNDITSSCLYVSALTIVYAGQYAFIALLIVSGVLFLFRKIYGEVVGALPLNGGAYNVLLNTTSKSNASVAACLTILSYMATAVISATEAMKYLHTIFSFVPVIIATLVLLTIFLMLTISGITESAVVATIIFVMHLTVMAVLIISAIYFVMTNGLDISQVNFRQPLKGSLVSVLFLGFSTAMLGISGFESSANFVEEQEAGVFPKTLRNMWVAVTIINPAIALLAVMTLPLNQVSENQEALLSFMGNKTGGHLLAIIISIDAVLVLSGAVLTSFVGVGGLLKRMTLDRVLPQLLLKENKKGSSPRILITFYILCLSVLFITEGELGPLAGVYTISFLSVMIYFGLGNFLLKIKRKRLPRPERATEFAVGVAVFAIIVALYGNVKLHPEYLVVFLQYFIPTVLLIYIFLRRNAVLKQLLKVANNFFDRVQRVSLLSRLHLTKEMRKLNKQVFLYFTKGDDISVLNKVIIYVTENEITRNLKIVTVLKENQEVSEGFMRDFDTLDRAYPDLKIEYVQIHGTFGPELIDKICREWDIPKNFMFISSPGNTFPHRVSDLGGVRLII